MAVVSVRSERSSGFRVKQLHNVVDFKKQIVALHFSTDNDNDNLFYLSYWHISSVFCFYFMPEHMKDPSKDAVDT